MTNIQWLSPVILRPLGWTLLHFLWQGAAIAALSAGALALTRRANTRYVTALFFLTLMLFLPVVTFFYYWQDSPRSAGQTPVITPSVPYATSELQGWNYQLPRRHRGQRPLENSLWLTWAVEAWLVGVVCFSLRTAGGLVLLNRLGRRQSLPLESGTQAICLDLQRRLGVRRLIRYCQCRALQSPVVIGWFRPMLLLPMSALSGLSAEQLEAIIAHELAHIMRWDAFVNAYQVLVETLLFYHPAVWWLSGRVRRERENCCDDAAVALCGNPLEYARALTLLEERRGMPALALAAARGPLALRITRLLGVPSDAAGRRAAGVTAGLACLAAALVAGNVLLQVAHAAPIQSGAVASEAPAAPSTATPAQPAIASVPAKAMAPAISATVRSSVSTLVNATVATSPAFAVLETQAALAEPAKEDEKPVPAESYIEALKVAGLKDLTVDELMSLKIQGVTPEYVRAMHEQGVSLDIDNLVAMKIQGVTPDFIKEMRAAGLTINDDEIVALKVQGVTTAYLRGLQDAGIHPNTDELIGLKVQGVTPDLVKALQGAGLSFDADQLIGLKVQGVTPEYVRGLQEQGIKGGADDLVGMRVQGVTVEYIREMHALGLKPNADELVSLKVQGVTPGYIKAMQAAGLKFDIDELIAAKVQGITPAFIEKARKHGFKDLDMDKLIELKNSGVLEHQAQL